MPDGKKKIISTKETGTVPKVKYWNNTAVYHDIQVSNNLTSSMLPNQERSHSDSRNRQRCSNYHCFEGFRFDDTRILPNCNSLPYINMSGGTTSPSTSGTSSRRHSGGAIRKCDNITKYPDKKHIEDKLNQIREYLKVTSSLMTSVKEDQLKNDENDELYQMLTALRDSEKKLEAMLITKHIYETSLENQDNEDTNNEISENGIPTLDTASVFPNYQNNNVATQIEQKIQISDKKLQALDDHQSLLLRLQEKAENQLRDARRAQERLSAAANIQYVAANQQQQLLESKNAEKNRCVELSQSSDAESEHLNLIPETNEGRGQLLRLLDARDNELLHEQHALQQKLHELNSKKQQIDQLVSQLHDYGGREDSVSDDGDDMTTQIRQIVAMKEQLANLKDMLAAVKCTETALLHQNNVECAEQVPVVKSGNVTKSGSVGLSDTETRSDSERRWGTMGKQSNKSSMSSSREQLQLQAELQAKKQELEELMYKDQDRTSAINQDVCNEIVMNKDEPPFSLESVPSSWTLLQDNTPPRDSGVSASRENVYSSDEEDLENYSQLNNGGTSKQSEYINCNFGKQFPNRPVVNSNPIMPDTASSPSGSQSFSQQWTGNEHKQQLELMTSLCQSLLEQQRQVIPTQCSPPNFQWYTSYMQMQQALMLSTISQCCQLLWLQQQDINTLINTVSMMQQHRVKPPQTINVSQPASESVASACSLPSRFPSNNTEYVGLAPRERASPQNLTRNIPVSVMPPAHQPVWNGAPTLNNQVPPGNRANNYWDNFRSYSRQNLLSTAAKSNEGSQNSLSMYDRSNASSSFCQPVGMQRSHPSSLQKINAPIQERASSAETNNHEIPRDVNRATSRSERSKSTKRNRANCRNRNEWNEEMPQHENATPKSKLFDVLRENVYKEVTLLISANENRPHFLIQLFRDLQMISSDPLRCSALQSIQSLITRSLNDVASSGLMNHIPQCTTDEHIPTTVAHPIPSASTPSRNKTEKSASRYSLQSNSTEAIGNYKLDPDAQRILMELLPFLKLHNDELFDNSLMNMIKMMIFQHIPAKQSTSRNKLQAKLDAIFTESLLKFKGKRIADIKEDLLKTIADILLEELPIATQQSKERQVSSSSDNHTKSMEGIANSLIFLAEHNNATMPPFDSSFQYMQIDQKSGRPNFSNVPRIDNGDLAEADQSRREAENDEGAVGGVLLAPADTHAPNNEPEVEAIINELQTDLDIFINLDSNH